MVEKMIEGKILMTTNVAMREMKKSSFTYGEEGTIRKDTSNALSNVL